jgi:predicted naringenin-chalcone synthase
MQVSGGFVTQAYINRIASAVPDDDIHGAFVAFADQMPLAASRQTLECFGNMSSAMVIFVLERLMQCAQPGEKGCAMSFGPGLTAETMLFHAA